MLRPPIIRLGQLLTAWQQVEGVGRLFPFVPFDNNGMTGVVPSRTPSAYVRLGREDVDELALPFVAPLCAKPELKLGPCHDAAVHGHTRR